MHDEVDRQGDGFTNASVWQPDIGGEHAMRQPRQGLVG
jgi:hypothetical protein